MAIWYLELPKAVTLTIEPIRPLQFVHNPKTGWSTTLLQGNSHRIFPVKSTIGSSNSSSIQLKGQRVIFTRCVDSKKSTGGSARDRAMRRAAMAEAGPALVTDLAAARHWHVPAQAFIIAVVELHPQQRIKFPPRWFPDTISIHHANTQLNSAHDPNLDHETVAARAEIPLRQFAQVRVEFRNFANDFDVELS